MGQKIIPTGFSVGFYQDWKSRWVTPKKHFGATIYEDYRIRRLIKKQAKGAGIASIEIERRGEEVTVFIAAARQGILIGKKGQEIDRIREMSQELCSGPLKIIIKEIQNPDTMAQIVAESIAEQLEKRMAFRRVMKKTIETTMAGGGVVEGVKIQLAGRLNGAEMARTEKASVGKMPRQTIRADIDYGFTEAATTYGAIGVKVWIYKGMKMKKSIHAQVAPPKAS